MPPSTSLLCHHNELRRTEKPPDASGLQGGLRAIHSGRGWKYEKKWVVTLKKEPRIRRSNLEGPRERQPVYTDIQQRLTHLAHCHHHPPPPHTFFFQCQQSTVSIMEVHCRFYLIFNFLINTKKCFRVKIPNNY